VKIFRKIKEYIRNVISELKRVSWAKRENLFRTTVVVIILSVLMAIFILIFDQIFSRVLNIILR